MRTPIAASRTYRRWIWLSLFATLSVVLHGAAVWLLLPHGSMRTRQETPPLIEIEMVDQAPQVKGVQARAPAQPPPAPATRIPPPPAPTAELPPPPPSRPLPPAPSPPGPEAPSSVNLGGSDEDLEGLSVTGDNVVPPRPDATIRNKPPGYPAAAVRRHAHGVVGLRIHVTEAGVTGWVDIVRSSGDASLDGAARDAAALWRFQPARDHGAPVAFDYEMNIRFTLDGR